MLARWLSATSLIPRRDVGFMVVMGHVIGRSAAIQNVQCSVFLQKLIAHLGSWINNFAVIDA